MSFQFLGTEIFPLLVLFYKLYKTFHNFKVKLLKKIDSTCKTFLTLVSISWVKTPIYWATGQTGR